MLLQKLRLKLFASLKKILQGDERKLKDGVVFLTVHDVGATYQVSLKKQHTLDNFFFVRTGSPS